MIMATTRAGYPLGVSSGCKFSGQALAEKYAGGKWKVLKSAS
jgi:hypothetical protein